MDIIYRAYDERAMEIAKEKAMRVAAEEARLRAILGAETTRRQKDNDKLIEQMTNIIHNNQRMTPNKLNLNKNKIIINNECFFKSLKAGGRPKTSETHSVFTIQSIW